MDYHSGARFKGKKVLLVGFGNSANDVSAAALFPGLFESLKEACSKNDASQVCCDLWEEGAETSVVIRSPVSLVPRSLWMCTRHPASLLLFLRKHPLLLFLLAQVLSRCFSLACEQQGRDCACALCAVIETLTYRAHWLRRLVADQIPGAREGVEPWRECFSVDPVSAPTPGSAEKGVSGQDKPAKDLGTQNSVHL